MDNRRMILAVCLSFVLLFGWQYIATYMGWMPEPVPVEEPAAPTTAQPAPIAPLVQEPQQINGTPAKDVFVETPLYKAAFNTQGGFVKSFELKKYLDYSDENKRPDTPVQMIKPEAVKFSPMGLLINGMPAGKYEGWAYEGAENLQVSDGKEQQVVFKANINNIAVSRTFSFDPATYMVKEKLELLSPVPQSLNIGYTMSTGNLAGEHVYNRENSIAYLQDGSFDYDTNESDLQNGISKTGAIGWGGVMSTYFLTAIVPADSDVVLDAKLEGGAYRVALKKNEIILEPGKAYQGEVSYYLGPKSKEDLERAPNELTKAINYGFFSFVSKPLMSMLNFFYNFTQNYGVAIILLTIVIKMVLWPLSYKSYKSMESMKKMQPMIAKLREKYKDDKQRMNQETMQLYKTYKINPMGGCLPILAQLPIFFGLYQALLNAIELRQACFVEFLPFTDWVWLADLSIRDPYYITPIVMGLSMLIQQRLTPTAADPMQAKVMMLMPIVFTFMFASFPSGLVVYWLVNNVISIAQQYWQLRLKKS